MSCVKIVNRFMRWHARAKVTHSVRVCRQDYRVFFLSYCEKGVAPCDEIVENNILHFYGGMAWQPILWCLAIECPSNCHLKA